jgi:hypothetical protein
MLSARLPDAHASVADDEADPVVRVRLDGAGVAEALPLTLSGNLSALSAAVSSGVWASVDDVGGTARHVEWLVLRAEVTVATGGGADDEPAEAETLLTLPDRADGAGTPLTLVVSPASGTAAAGAAAAALPAVVIAWDADENAAGRLLGVSVTGDAGVVPSAVVPTSAATTSLQASFDEGTATATLVGDAERVAALLAAGGAFELACPASVGNATLAVQVWEPGSGLPAATANVTLAVAASRQLYLNAAALPAVPVEAAPLVAAPLGVGASVLGGVDAPAAAVNVSATASHGVVSLGGNAAGASVWYLAANATDASLAMAAATYTAQAGFEGVDEVELRVGGTSLAASVPVVVGA